MKKTFFVISVVILDVTLLFSACNYTSKKVDKAQENITELKQEITVEKNKISNGLKDSIQQFKYKSEEKIRKNEKIIAGFKAKITDKKEKTKIIAIQKLDDLEQRNNDLISRLDNYHDDTQQRWDSFQVEYNNDMNELEIAFKNFAIKNEK